MIIIDNEICIFCEYFQLSNVNKWENSIRRFGGFTYKLIIFIKNKCISI